MSELVVVKTEEQTRREMCEDCQHSRGDGNLLRCALRYDQPCKLSRALRTADAECPRGDEYAMIWKAANLDESEAGCGESRESYAAQVARLKAIRSGVGSFETKPQQLPAEQITPIRGLRHLTITVYESHPIQTTQADH